MRRPARELREPLVREPGSGEWRRDGSGRHHRRSPGARSRAAPPPVVRHFWPQTECAPNGGRLWLAGRQRDPLSWSPPAPTQNTRRALPPPPLQDGEQHRREESGSATERSPCAAPPLPSSSRLSITPTTAPSDPKASPPSPATPDPPRPASTPPQAGAGFPGPRGGTRAFAEDHCPERAGTEELPGARNAPASPEGLVVRSGLSQGAAAAHPGNATARKSATDQRRSAAASTAFHLSTHSSAAARHP